MQIETAIHLIESTYPIDSGYKGTDKIGAELMIESILDYGWRNLPEEILQTLSSKCTYRLEQSEANELRQTRRSSY